MKDVLISIKGIQGIDEEKDVIEFTTEGRYGIKDGKYYLYYDEGQMMENCEVKTRIFINSPSSLVLQRSGSIKSRMEIEKEKRNSCFYSTPIGELCIGIYGEKLDINLNDSGGSIEMIYTIDSDLRMVSRNEVKITIKEV